jgi:hypothetical protein
VLDGTRPTARPAPPLSLARNPDTLARNPDTLAHHSGQAREVASPTTVAARWVAMQRSGATPLVDVAEEEIAERANRDSSQVAPSCALVRDIDRHGWNWRRDAG